MKRINVYISDGHAAWLDTQSRAFNLSAMFRHFLDSLINKDLPTAPSEETTHGNRS